MKKAIIYLMFPAFGFISSCHVGGRTDEQLAEEAGMIQSGEMTLTKVQFDGAGMKVGDPEPRMFSQEISADGTIGSAPYGRAKINTLISGRIHRINYSLGDQVKKGNVLFTLQSNEIILLQQEYAEVVQKLLLLASDYKRLKSLSEENIVARKDFLKTESEYLTMQARAEGLRSRLIMINIDPSAVEKGLILPELSVLSPIDGSVTRQELVLGQFVEPGETVMEVIDPGKLQLNIWLFENDLDSLLPGQNVQYFTPGNEDQIFEATLSKIGRSLDIKTKTVQCIARIKPEDMGNFVNNLFVETRIITCEREALAIPESALTREPDRDFVWIRVEEDAEQIKFRKVPVKTGVTINGNTEILEEGLSGILLEGAYNLWSEN